MQKKVKQTLEQHILPVLADRLRGIIKQVPDRKLNQLVEIRLRAGKPLLIETVSEELLISSQGDIVSKQNQGCLIDQQDLQETLNLMTNSSLYTVEEELKSGYLTLSGGHRVGFVGQVIRDGRRIKRIKYISGLNIRLCQEIIGAADGVIEQVIAGTDDIYNTLIISPPRCGKTTLLRDLIRQISDGIPRLNFTGLKVGVVDERSELGGAYQGVPQNRLGIRTDVLDRGPKKEGILLLIRSMSPEVIATDEIGTKEDVEVLKEALNAGVRVVTTVHGRNLQEIKSRPILQGLFTTGVFDRFITLSRRQGPGTVEKVK